MRRARCARTVVGVSTSWERAAADLALAVLAALSIPLITRQIEPSGDELAVDGLAYACMVLAGLALAARRRWPLPTVAVVTAALAVYAGRGYAGGPVFVTLFVALY